MTADLGLATAAARAALVGGLAVGAATLVQPLLAHPSPRGRRIAWLLLLLPVVTPALLVGYGYANFSLSLVRHPAVNHFFYMLLLLLKLTPLAAIVLHFGPRPLSASAMHCYRLSLTPHYLCHISRSGLSEADPLRGVSRAELGERRPTARGEVRERMRQKVPSILRPFLFRLRAGCYRTPAAAWSLVWMFAFAEFEMASLLGVPTWTVKVFDAHAGGLALAESWRLMAFPLAAQVVVLAVGIFALARHRATRGLTPPATPGRFDRAWVFLGGAAALVLLVPAALVLRGAATGFAVLWENFALARELVVSAGAAGAAAIGVWLLSRRYRTGLIPLAVLGLLGPLVLALSGLALLQLPGLREGRDTFVPYVTALGLWLLPCALVLQLAVASVRPGPAVHLAGLLPAPGPRTDLIWHLQMRAQYWSVGFLFLLAYWDMTAGAILAPLGMAPVTVRLYNLMHYGRTAVLSAMVVAACLVPVGVLLIARVGWRLGLRCQPRTALSP